PRVKLELAPAVDGPGRMRLNAAAGHYQLSHPGCRGHSVSLDRAPERLPPELHPLFRIAAAVLARRISAAASRGTRRLDMAARRNGRTCQHRASGRHD